MAKLSDLYNSEYYSTLNAPSYPIAQASRLVGVTKGRVARWLRGYKYTYEIEGGDTIREGKQQAVVKRTTPKESTYASFLDLIDLLFVKRFIDRGFSLQFIRGALQEARERLHTPHFASSTFYTSGKDILLDISSAPKGIESLLALLTGGQQAFSQIFEKVGEKVDFEDVTGFGLASRWFPQGKAGHIVIDPQISFGQPTIMGHRITTSNIFDIYVGENEQIDNVTKWYSVPANKINSAIRFETSMNA